MSLEKLAEKIDSAAKSEAEVVINNAKEQAKDIIDSAKNEAKEMENDVMDKMKKKCPNWLLKLLLLQNKQIKKECL